MAEKIVSPGVFTNENDLSFLPQGIAEIGAAIIGPTQKGPAFVPTLIESQNDFSAIFGDGTYYTSYAVKNYLKSAGRVTIVRVLGSEGYTASLMPIVTASANGQVLAVIAPTRKNAGFAWGEAIPPSSSAWGSGSDFYITASVGSYSCSFDESSDKYIVSVLGTNPMSNQVAFYVYANFSTFQSKSIAESPNGFVTASTKIATTFGAYDHATTPWIQSQDFNGSKFNLFKVHARSDGTYVNTELKIGIYDVKFAGEVPGSDYGTFGLIVRSFDDTDRRQEVLETFSNLSLDPDSSRYYVRVIGDRYSSTDSDGKVTYYGDWDNKSDYIRLEAYPANSGSLPAAVPFGFSAYKSIFNSTLAPAVSMAVSQTIDDETNTKAYFGVDFINSSGEDLVAHFGALPSSTVNVTGSSFNLSDHLGGGSGTLAQRKFIMGLQGGFDGKNVTTEILQGVDITSGNTQGFNCTDATTSGTVDYKKALDTITNPDEIDVNLIVIPGIIYSKHSSVANYAINICEDRGDCFYIMDSTIKGEAIDDATGYVEAVDTNYAATYYPWVKILDPNTTKPVWVPPSVVMCGVYAFNDSIAQPWYAPAGLNRGGITEAVEAESRLTHANRDDLYEGRVNPIASFPGQGVVAWGQKTLQVKASALDRVNVRRLLIAVKKYIASTSRYLVFEQNVSATRNRFLNIVNPYLESVQQRNGLYAFKVVMDETNNTPDIIDRNQLYGQIYLQPARTAEFIVLDFNILPTGASFPE